jgi:hypothetical protein
MNTLQKNLLVFSAALLFLSASSVQAAQIPVANIDIIAKRLTDGKIITLKTDDTGAFTIYDQGNNPYYLWLQNEDAPPTKVTSADGKIHGKLLFVVDDPLPVKKTPVKKPVVKTPAAKPKN